MSTRDRTQFDGEEPSRFRSKQAEVDWLRGELGRRNATIVAATGQLDQARKMNGELFERIEEKDRFVDELCDALMEHERDRSAFQGYLRRCLAQGDRSAGDELERMEKDYEYRTCWWRQRRHGER